MSVKTSLSRVWQKGLARRTARSALAVLSSSLLMLAMSASSVSAQTQPSGLPGSLDSSFNGIGKAVLNIPGYNPNIGRGIAVQPDGKVVTTGYASSAGLKYMALARQNADGTVDTGFGTAGEVVGIVNSIGNSVLVLPGGKLLAGGFNRTDTTNGYGFLARFNADGSVDTSFGGGNGWVRVSLPYINATYGFSAMAMQGDGKIVASAWLTVPQSGTNYDLVVARMNPDGSLDTSFGNGGVTTIDAGSSTDAAKALIIQSDGRIVVGGAAPGVGAALARLNTDGSLDASFGTGGKVITTVTPNASINSLALDANGDIVAAGSDGSTQGNVLVLAYKPNGSLDASFGGGVGYVSTIFGASASGANGVVAQRDGKIVAGGFGGTDVNGKNDFILVRYNLDGSVDSSFSGGAIQTDFTGGVDGISALALQSDGKIVAAGWSNNAAGSTTNFALARYLGDQADLSLSKTASASTVTAGTPFTYTLTVTNNGPQVAQGVVINDALPSSLSFISCNASGGTCGSTGNSFQASFASLAVGSSGTVTVTVLLAANTAAGTTLVNTASAQSLTNDPNPSNNTASAAITAVSPPPHTLTYYLHGTDLPPIVPGTFVMSQQAATSQLLALNLLDAPQWYTADVLNGTFPQGATFQFTLPCLLGLKLGTYELDSTDVNGNNVQVLGQVGQPLLCLGSQTVSFPVSTPLTLSNRRLRFTMSSVLSLILNLQLGQGTYVQATPYIGTP